ncbi:MAG: WbqC family protein [Bacteroidota bacterium]
MNTGLSSDAGNFPSCYLPSVEYFIQLHKFGEVVIDTNEQYRKQTVRNRCFILSPNGIQCLSVPVIYHSSERQTTRQIKISYVEPWQKIHCRAIKSAYGRSAYFEFYSDELEAFYLRQYEYLHELNSALLLFLLKKMKSPVSVNESVIADEKENFTLLANAKNNSMVTDISCKSYNQVFQSKFGFTENLSALDLLFNTGNRAVEYLK